MKCGFISNISLKKSHEKNEKMSIRDARVPMMYKGEIKEGRERIWG